MDEYTRSDFIDDSIVIDFEITKDLWWEIQEYEKAINNKEWCVAEDINANMWVILKNTLEKYSKDEISKIKEKYKI